jgi:hypothetical protein
VDHQRVPWSYGFQREIISLGEMLTGKQHSRCPIMEMSVNGPTQVSGHTCRLISGWCIRTKYFHPGGMALSEWMHSGRAMRDTLVADYSVPGVNLMLRIPYHPLIDVSQCHLVVSVSNLQRSLWCCCQL